MDLEKLVKTSFDQFEPEVNPSVWQRLEQNLNTPSTSADPSGTSSITGKTALKTILGNTNPWFWVAGIISTAAIVMVIVTTSPKKNTVVPVIAPTTINDIAVDKALDNSNVIQSENNVISVQESPKNEVAFNKEESKKFTAEKTAIEHHSESPVTASSNQNKSSEASSTKAPPSTPQKVNEQASENAPVNQSANTNKPVATIESVIIINSQVGFAPFKIVALLNKEDAKGNWDFGDGQTSIGANTITHSFTKPGTYKLLCTVGEKTIEKTIEVIGSVSTAFTPNGDGVNDEFYVESSQLLELSVKILDRSGRVVFEITQPGQHWDGKDENGENLTSGTYFYNIFARSDNGQINQKGTISIFR